jgi:hypothetical protein
MTIVEGHAAFVPDASIPVLDADPFDEEVLRAPHDFYVALREAGPIAFIPGCAILAIGRYEEVRSVFSDYARFVSSRGVGLNDFKVEEPWRQPSLILESDPPVHGRVRAVMARALSPKVAQGLRDSFRAEAEALVDDLLAQERVEAVEDIAERFPTTAFPKAVGMRDVNRRNLVDYGAMAANAFGPDNALRRAALARAPEIVPWVTAACARDRLEPGGIGMAIYAGADAGDVTENEAMLLVRSLFSAGVDTTVTGLGNTLWCLSQHPEAWARLRADPDLVRPCIDEAVRIAAPIHSFSRTADLDTEIAGHPVPEGAKVLCVLASANLDPRKWDDPDSFRIDRRPGGHLGFGTGIHGCVGQHIARAEIEAVLLALAARVRAIEPDGPAVWRPNNAMRALDRLPLRLVPA